MLVLVHLWHLIWRSLAYMPSIISGNWVSIFFPLAVFLVGEGIRIKKEGRRTVNWLKVRRDFLLMLGAYTVLFGWAIVRTVYHQDLVKQVNGLSAKPKSVIAVLDMTMEGEINGKYPLVVVSLNIQNPSGGPPRAFSQWSLTSALAGRVPHPRRVFVFAPRVG
jgi:hypothetical protein